MEAGLKELGAALLAGVVLVVVLDFVYTNATTGGYFSGAAFQLPGTGGSGGLPPPSAQSTTTVSLPDPITA